MHGHLALRAVEDPSPEIKERFSFSGATNIPTDILEVMRSALLESFVIENSYVKRICCNALSNRILVPCKSWILRERTSQAGQSLP